MRAARAVHALVCALMVAGSAAHAIVAVDPPAASDALAPYLAPGRAGALASWIEPAAGGALAVRFARFDGTAWSQPTTVVESAALFSNWADTPGVVEAGDGAIVAWWLEKLGAGTYAYGVKVARSTDGGASFAPLGWLHDDRSESEHGFVSAAAEATGARLFWLDGRSTPGGGAMSLRTTTVTDQVAPSQLVDDAVCDCCSTAALATGGGAVVAYRDRAPGEIRDIFAVRVGGGISAPSAVGADGWKIEGCPVNGPALAVAGDTLYAAWYTAASERGRVQLARSTDAGASFGAAELVDGSAPLGRVGLAPLDGTEVALVWAGRAGDRAELRLARAGPSGAPGPPLALASTSGGRRSGVPRIVRLADGRLLVLWTRAEEGQPTRLAGALVAAGELPAR